MLRVYNIPHSLYGAKLRILLRYKELTWEETPPPGGYGSDVYKQIVPTGNLPALVDGDLMIADGEAIAEYLEERFPDPPALPSGIADRARARELSRFHDTRLEPALRALFPHLPGRAPAPDGFLVAQAEAINTRLRQLARIQTPETGHMLTLGDCGFPATFAWLDGMSATMGFEIEWPEGIIAYRERIAELPAVADEMAEYAPRVAEFLGA